MTRWFGALLVAAIVGGCDAGTVVGGGDASTDARDASEREVPFADVHDEARIDAVDTMDAIDSFTPPDDVAIVVDAAPDAGPHVCPTSSPLDCSAGTGTGMGDQCADAPSCYLAAVQRAVRDVIAAHPEWFDYNNAGMCPNILQVDSYMDAVVANLGAAGLCAIRDPNASGEEVTVKHDNDFSENFDIVASTGCARYGSLIYTGYCAPAWW